MYGNFYGKNCKVLDFGHIFENIFLTIKYKSSKLTSINTNNAAKNINVDHSTLAKIESKLSRSVSNSNIVAPKIAVHPKPK